MCMCTQRGFSSCYGILKYKLKLGLVIGCATATVTILSCNIPIVLNTKR